MFTLTLASCGGTDGNDGQATASGDAEISQSNVQLGAQASKNIDKTHLATSSKEPRGFGQCKVCHSVEIDGPAGVGPNLHGIFGKSAADKKGYNYSPALKKAKINWGRSELDAFLESPGKMVPGTKMAFAGLNDPDRRSAIVEYLKTLQ
ncbi:MAG: hypothetical protein COA41_06105 [Sphingopyxis sp.]|nr:MAG: hypothetical protein COA41_06105 [Sphingopyxis sp.]